MMPAQEETPDSEAYESDASSRSEPFVAERQAKTVAKKSNAPKAGQVSFSAQPAPSTLSCARRAVHFAACISVSREFCRRRRSLLSFPTIKRRTKLGRRSRR